MKITKNLLVILLFLLPAISITYKVQFKKIDFIPQKSSDTFNIEIQYSLDSILKDVEEEFSYLPLFHNWYGQEVIEQKFELPDGANISDSLEGKVIAVKKGSIGTVKIFSQIKLSDRINQSLWQSPVEVGAPELKLKNIELSNKDPEYVQALEDLSNKLAFGTETHSEIAHKIFLFISEEITTNSAINNPLEVMSLGEGSLRAKKKLMNDLAKLNKIPARMNLIFQIEKISATGTKLATNLLPEVLIDNLWKEIRIQSLTTTDTEKKDYFILLGKNSYEYNRLFNGVDASIKIMPIMLNKVDSREYKKQLSSVSQFFSILSLHNFPVSLQSVFYTILLIPVGTILLSFFKNIVGLKTFGIFTPILLSLFILETSLLIGFMFFGFIVLIGFGQRYILDKFHLLAVPRLSILLTLVVITFSLTGLFAIHQKSIINSSTLNYFPIVIIAVFIERFSVNFIEEGMRNTMKALIGTLTISICCYFVLKSEFLKLALFNHPELLLTVIAINFLIGSYKGYRLSEFIRFKEFQRIES